MKCPHCGHTMNHHADKPVKEGFRSEDGAIQLIEAYSCPHCGTNASRTIQGD